MSARERLGSPWVTASLALILVVLLAASAVLAGAVTLPSINVSFDVFGPIGGGGAARATPAPAPTPTPTPPEPSFIRPTPSPEPTFLSYRVGPGETLTSIAKKFQTTPRSIAWWNRGTYPSLDPESPSYKPNSIKVGWILAILPGQVVDDNNPPTPSPAPESPTPSSS